MKNYTAALLIVMATALSSSAQEKSVTPPAAAKIAFEKKFPGATKIKWGKEKTDFEVNFKQNGTEMAAVYDNSGTCKETEVTIQNTELPAAVQTYVQKHFSGSKIKEAAKITYTNGVVNYEAEVNKQDLLFDVSGKFLKVAKD